MISEGYYMSVWDFGGYYTAPSVARGSVITPKIPDTNLITGLFHGPSELTVF
jgi:hypothetical protein